MSVQHQQLALIGLHVRALIAARVLIRYYVCCIWDIGGFVVELGGLLNTDRTTPSSMDEKPTFIILHISYAWTTSENLASLQYATT